MIVDKLRKPRSRL